MDLLFQRYASPYFLIDEMLELGQLNELVYTIVNAENDKKLWEIYLALLSNPYAEVGSFKEFKHKNQPSKEIDLEATVKESSEILRNFTP